MLSSISMQKMSTLFATSVCIRQNSQVNFYLEFFIAFVKEIMCRV